MSVTDADQAKVAAERLEAIAGDLSGRGFAATVEQGHPHPAVQIVNRDVTRLSETIHVDTDEDGSWWFWWSWGDRLAPIDDVEGAAFKVAYVLTPHD